MTPSRVVFCALMLVTTVKSFAPSGTLFVSRACRRTSSTQNMFTGIVEEMGTVISLEERNDMTLWDGTTGVGTELTVQGNVVLDGAYLGCVLQVKYHRIQNICWMLVEVKLFLSCNMYLDLFFLLVWLIGVVFVSVVCA
jgi:hypothetical protein